MFASQCSECNLQLGPGIGDRRRKSGTRSATRAARSPQHDKVPLAHCVLAGELDHIGMSASNLERSGFEVHDVEGWREQYARTTRFWHDRLLANHAFTEREIGAVKTRLWLRYVAGVSIGFERGRVGVFQTFASKRRRGASGLPLLSKVEQVCRSTPGLPRRCFVWSRRCASAATSGSLPLCSSVRYHGGLRFLSLYHRLVKTQCAVRTVYLSSWKIGLIGQIVATE
jgi:hypothetical protein